MTHEEENLLVEEGREIRWDAVNVADASREGDWKRMSEHLLALKKRVDRLVVTLGLEG